MTDYYVSSDKVKKEVIQITMRGVPLELHDRINQEAKRNRRSMNSELIFILEKYFLEIDRFRLSAK